MHTAPTHTGSKADTYSLLHQQLTSLLSGEKDLIANLSNTAALLKETFGWWWVGFYLVKKDELVLGPFQGPVACTRIGIGKGVCGTAWAQKQSIVVPDVHEFPGHIACSAASNSEIVVPIIKNNEVVGVLDADSEHLNYFNNEDKAGLEAICVLLAQNVF